MDPATGRTKLEMVRYYEAIAQWALPHLMNRPLALVRAPDGISGELFSRSIARGLAFRASRSLRRSCIRVIRRYSSLTPEALVGLAQMSGCSYIRGMQWHLISSILIGVIFDLDPDAVLPWTMMTEAAMLLTVVLDEMGLSSFPKTSGGRASMLSCR
ncbi:hypothetical protein PSAB6_50111 [Paraburkholderia sabiae]|nr:hypothetical protein [Paraburkholderia sabiae]CAG9228981.1 hypothetical protein PSAB6_50111 [Paraburkholderia sabiae]